MKNIATILFSIVFIQLSISQDFRPPSVPLIAHDPYFSIWSPSDRLYDRETVHWTGRNHPMHSLIRIDGKTYRLMGAMPGALEPVKQMSVKVYPTRTIYEFQNYLINIQLVFTSPALPSDLDLFSRPVTYISWVVKTIDGKPHDVQLYFDCSGEIAVNNTDQNLKWDSPAIDGLQTVRIGSADQPILKKRGDDLRIDWGYAYLSVPNTQKTQTMVGERGSKP